MTRCTKVVRRESFASLQGRPIIISIEPPSLIGLRLKGTRRTEYLPADSAYWIAVKARLACEKRDKTKAKGRIRTALCPCTTIGHDLFSRPGLRVDAPGFGANYTRRTNVNDAIQDYRLETARADAIRFSHRHRARYDVIEHSHGFEARDPELESFHNGEFKAKNIIESYHDGRLMS